MFRRFALLAFGVLISNSGSASTFEISLSNDTARFHLSGDAKVRGMGTTAKDGGIMYNENDDIFAYYGFRVHSGARGRTLWQTGVGGRLYLGYLDLPGDAQTTAALAVGGRVQVNPFMNQQLGFALEGYYAPRIVTFIDAEQFWEAEFTVRYQMMTTAEIFAGVRQVELELKNISGEYEFDEAGFIGVRFGF